MGVIWEQKRVKLSRKPRGCHLVTKEILSSLNPILHPVKVGIAHFFLQHTSASLTLNENWDTNVRLDMESTLNRIVPEGEGQYLHSEEGDDDMPAHVKSSLFGVSLTIPISEGKLCLGTWQGIWLCEHRNEASGRSIVVTVQGSGSK